MTGKPKKQKKTPSLVTRGQKRADMTDVEIRIENSKLFGGVMGYAHALHYGIGVMVEEMILNNNQCGIVSFSLNHPEAGTNRRISMILAHGDEESETMYDFYNEVLSKFNKENDKNGKE